MSLSSRVSLLRCRDGWPVTGQGGRSGFCRFAAFVFDRNTSSYGHHGCSASVLATGDHVGTGTPANRFIATACPVIQTTATAIRSTWGQSVTAPKAMTKLLAHAGGCGQDSRTNSPQVTARASDALTIVDQPPVCMETGPPAAVLTRYQTAHPDAIPEKWPSTIDRGAADSVVGVAKRINAVGPSAGNISGRSVIQAKKPIARMASPPLTAATSETAFRSSKRASKPTVLYRARQMAQRVFSDSRLVGCNFIDLWGVSQSSSPQLAFRLGSPIPLAIVDAPGRLQAEEAEAARVVAMVSPPRGAWVLVSRRAQSNLLSAIIEQSPGLVPHPLKGRGTERDRHGLQGMLS